jgi:hypothetical protein
VTDTTISTDPATLRAVADTLAPKGGAEDVFIAVLTLRAIAVEKEAQAAPAADLRAAIGKSLDDFFGSLHSERIDAVISAITAAGYEIRPRGEATAATGWRLVPVQPTEEMLEALKSAQSEGLTLADSLWAANYAAPKTPEIRPRAYTAGESLGSELVAAPASEMTEAMMRAAYKYLSDRSVTGRANLPGGFDWHEFWTVQITALTEKGEPKC